MTNQAEIDWHQRYAELESMRKVALARHYRSVGYIGGKYPPETWTKDEIIRSIMGCEGYGETAPAPDYPPAPEDQP